MKEIRISLEHIDLEALLERSIRFLRKQLSREVDYIYGIVRVEALGDVRIFGPESGWDVLSVLKQEGETVFFPFAFADVDGTLTFGYLVRVKGGTVIINSAIGCFGPSPRVNLAPDCGILEGPMEKFIRSFIKD